MMVIKLNQKREIMDLNDISEQLEEYERELARKNKIENMLISNEDLPVKMTRINVKGLFFETPLPDWDKFPDDSNQRVRNVTFQSKIKDDKGKEESTFLCDGTDKEYLAFTKPVKEWINLSKDEEEMFFTTNQLGKKWILEPERWLHLINELLERLDKNETLLIWCGGGVTIFLEGKLHKERVKSLQIEWMIIQQLLIIRKLNDT